MTDENGSASIYGIPAKSKKLSVKGVTKKVDYTSEGVNLDSFVDVKTAEAKIGKKIYKLSQDAINVELYDGDDWYNDKSKKDKTTNTGTFTLSVGPDWSVNCGSLSADSVYEPTIIKVQHKGKKLGSGMLKLAQTKFDWSADGPTLNFVAKDGLVPAKVKLYVPAQSSGEKNNFAWGSTSVVNYTKELGTLDKYGSGLKTSDIAAGNKEDYKAPGTHYIWVESTGEYTGGYFLRYTINPIKYSKKDGNVVVKINGKTDKATFTYNPAGHGNVVSVYVNGNKSEESSENYTVTWKDAKIGEDGGTLTVKGTGKTFTGTITLNYDVKKADLKTAKNYASLTGDPDPEYVYYVLNSKHRGSKTIPTELKQYAYNVNSGKYDVYTLKSGKDYVVTADTEGATATKGYATFDAAKSKFYENSVYLGYALYPNEVKSVAITLSNNGSVSLNDAVGKKIADYEGTGIIITKVVVSYKDSSVKSDTFDGWEAVQKACNITYEDNTVATTKAKVTISFKDGTKYPTGSSWSRNYTITSK